jgi:hypothetical protein
MRYRLIASNGDITWHEEGLEAARASASDYHLASGAKPEERTSVLLCEAPLGAIVRHVETIPARIRRVRR